MRRDIRYALRTLANSRGVTVVAILSLALGIGVTTAVFSLLDVILLRPLPVPEADRLVSLYHQHHERDASLSTSSYPNYEYYRDHNQVFDGLLAFVRIPTSIRFGDITERVHSALVTENYFDVIGVQPVLGRGFIPSDRDQPVTVISYKFWQSRFRGDDDVIGRTLRVHDSRFTVIGVAPEGFGGVTLDWGGAPGLWFPIHQHRAAVPYLSSRFDPLAERGMDFLLITARLRDGVTIEQAQAAMSSLRASLVADHLGGSSDWDVLLLPTQQARFWPGYRGTVRTFLGLLVGVVVLVLLIACANVANLLLTRAARRQSEIAVRLALGASRARLARQILTESMVLALAGGAAGLLIAHWTMSLLAGFERPFRIPLSLEASLDLRVLAFALAISMCTGILFGLAPLRQAGRLDLTGALKQQGGRLSRGFGLDNAILVAQVALSLVLLTGAGLFLRTLGNARAVDVTRDPGSVLMAKIDPSVHGYDDEGMQRFYPQLLDRVRAIPGVDSAGMVWLVPLSGMRGGANVSVDGADPVQVDTNVVTPGYFETIGIPLLRGRDFASGDSESAPQVVIVNQRFAENFWPGVNAIGKQIRLTRPSTLAEVVGVVADGPMRGVRDEKRPGFYHPLSQAVRGGMSLQVRVATDPAGVLAQIKREVAALDPNLPLAETRTLRAHQDIAVSGERLVTTLLIVLGVLALVLAAIGIYGVISYAVARRTREFGVRIALGARTADVLRTVLSRTIALIVAGAVIGITAAIACARLVESLLFGVTPADPLTLVAVPFLLLAVAVAAAMLPARRATRVDPAASLRYE